MNLLYSSSPKSSNNLPAYQVYIKLDVYLQQGSSSELSKVHFKDCNILQEIPDATKQAKWTGADPPKFDWDKEIKKVVEEGKEVPEIAWLKPGEDAAWEVGICS